MQEKRKKIHASLVIGDIKNGKLIMKWKKTSHAQSVCTMHDTANGQADDCRSLVYMRTLVVMLM
jgi:hypothetical protein